MTTTPTDEPLVSEIRSGPDLLGMAAAADVTPDPGSALAMLAAGFTTGAAGEPPAGSWPRILRTLATSHRRVDGAISGTDGSLVMAFHGDEEHWVGLWPDNDGFRVTGPLTDRGLGGYLGVFFGTLRTPSDTAPVVVSEHGIAGVAAAVDAWRTTRLTEWLRHADVGSSFTTDSATQALYAGKRSADPRWLVALLGDVSPVARESDDATIGLNELTEHDLLHRYPDGTIELGLQLNRLADDTWFPLPALTMTSGTQTPERRLIAMRGRNTVWTMSTSGKEWHIDGCDGLGLADLVARLVAD